MPVSSQAPCGAHAFGGLDLHGAALLPDHCRGQGADERQDDHRQQQRGASLAAGNDASVMACCGASTASRASRCSPKASIRRAPRGQQFAPLRATARRGGREVAAGLRVAPAVATEEVHAALRLTSSSSSSCPGSLPSSCWLRSQLSCSAAVRVTTGPAQRCHCAPRSDQATICTPPSTRARQAHRGAVEGQRGHHRACRTAMQVLLPLRDHGVQAQLRSICAWLMSRARTMPSTPRQAIVASTAMIDSATSTSTSVKPRARRVRGAWRLARLQYRETTVDTLHQLAAGFVTDTGIDRRKFGLACRPHDQLAA